MRPAIAGEIVATVDQTTLRLTSLSQMAARRRPAPEKWSVQEIMGHLIDSAANNHQRFIRAQESDELRFPRYAQDHWVDAQAYNDAPWEDVLALWRSYNHHLARVIQRIPESKAGVTCHIGDKKPVTLEFLVDEYLEHLKHHLGQVEKILADA